MSDEHLMDFIAPAQTSRSFRARCASAFTFIEVMVVIVVIGILAAIVVPQFGGVTDDAYTSSAQGSLGGVRSAIAGFRSRAILAGSAPFPTIPQLTTPGTVVHGEFPMNPFNNRTNVQAVSAAQAAARTVINSTGVGWNYYFDNLSDPPVAIFYANSSNATNVSNGSGGKKTANQL